MSSEFYQFAQEIWYVCLSFSALLGFGFGLVFWSRSL